jgi:hypothetical protein
MVYASPKLESATDVPNLGPIVREVGSSIIGVVQIRALSDDELHQIYRSQRTSRLLLVVDKRINVRWLDGNAAGLSEPDLKGAF